MTYETKTTLEPAWASWLSDEENLQFRLKPPLMPENYKPWDGWDANCHIGSLSGDVATQENILNLHHIADRQTVSTNMENADYSNYIPPSLELYQEMIWDRTEGLGMTEEEVQDLAIWAGHKFLGFSQRDLANSWNVTRGVVQGTLRKFERRADKPQGVIDIQNAVLVTAMSV